MSGENVEIVRRWIEAYNRRDMETWCGLIDPEIEYHDAPGLPGGGVHRGREAFRRHVESYIEAWSESRIEIEEIRPVGDRVVARIRYVGVGRATGIQVETPGSGAVYELREGRCLRVRQFADHAEALEAVGLRE